MNGFHDFDNFRVSAWMSEGVMIRMAEAEKIVKKVVQKAAASVAAAVIVASTVSVPATAATSPVVSANEHVVSSVSPSSELKAEISLEAELDALAAQMSMALTRLEGEQTVQIDADLLALAQLALNASDERREDSPLAIAEAFFVNGR